MQMANFSNKYGGIHMIPSIQRKIAALVISLAIQVISLTGMAYAAFAPNVTNLSPVTSGVMTPQRMAVYNPQGFPETATFYVADPRSGGVQVYNAYNALVKTIKTAAAPKAVAIGTAGTTSGKLIVSQGSIVSVYDPSTGAELFRL